MASIVDYITGPRLYGLFSQPNRQEVSLESAGSSAISLARGVFYVFTSLAFSPIIITYMYSRGWMTPASCLTILKFASYAVIFGYGARTIGRLMDDQYKSFLDVWAKACNGSSSDVVALKKYDFELQADKIVPDYIAKPNDKLWYLIPELKNSNPIVKAIGYYAIHAFGRHMLYPGSLAILNYMMRQNLNGGRNILVNQKQGQRIWLKSTRGDLIDAMFVQGAPENREYLVITSEGNAGFYEIGIAGTVMQAGYSVLSWNHPGFAESSGIPLPPNTLSAADAVMQYAINVLKYPVNRIVLFGWSIGGFPTTWLAANYPDVKGVILDATFDDVLPLALSRMPRFASGIVEHAIRSHANLQIDKMLDKYDGPLRLIRRLHEEILTIADEGTSESMRRASNRINFLLKSVIRKRHPSVIEGLEPQVDRWLDMSPTERIMNNGVNLTDGSRQRKRLFDACSHYLVDFDSNHVSPLDPLYFSIPEARSNF